MEGMLVMRKRTYGTQDGSPPPPAGEMAEPLGGREHDEGDIDVAENRELVGFLDEPIATLGEGHLAISVVLYPLYLELNAPHDPIKANKREREREKKKGKTKKGKSLKKGRRRERTKQKEHYEKKREKVLRTGCARNEGRGRRGGILEALMPGGSWSGNGGLAEFGSMQPNKFSSEVPTGSRHVTDSNTKACKIVNGMDIVTKVHRAPDYWYLTSHQKQ